MPAPFIALEEANDESVFGGKAVQLGAARRAGLPVPPGVALSYEQALTLFRAKDLVPLSSLLSSLGPIVAVRSSGVGEDSATASFAGQHATVLGVRSAEAILSAIGEVLESAHTESAIAYRKKLGLNTEPKIGVVVQKLVLADVAGVLFSRNPITRADERVVEATWGLGEAVVQGIVTPDRFRVARDGTILERTAGEKDLAIQWSRGGGTEEVEVDPVRVHALCLGDEELRSLHALATRCEATFGGTQDLEFAFEGGQLFLLQRRAITRE